MRLARTSLAWLAIAGLMFAVAIALTMMITWVEGGVLEHGARNSDGGEDDYQTLSIYTTMAETPDISSNYQVSYSENAAGDNTRLKFHIPAGETPILLVSGLVDAKACSSPRSPDDIALNEKEHGGVNVTITPAVRRTADEEMVFLVRPAPSPDQAVDVSCQILQASHAETFTSRRLPLLFSAEPMTSLVAGLPPEAIPGVSPEALARFQPTPEALLSFARIPGAKNIHFLGGFEAIDTNSRETNRLTEPDEFIEVFWDDEYREQFRDILLIVIGTLIGIGVTVTIEGLRPLIERLEQQGGLGPEASKPAPEPSEPTQSLIESSITD